MAECSDSMEDSIFSIQKYARLATPCQMEDSSMSEENSKERWIYHNATDEVIKLRINKESQFVLQQGSLVLESFSLILASGNLRAIAKGDSILVVCKAMDYNRKFRLQFCDEANRSGIERCSQCLKLLCSYVQIKRTNMQGIQKPPAGTSSDPNDSSSETEIDEEIVRCLLDANFHALVNKVEERLHHLF